MYTCGWMHALQLVHRSLHVEQLEMSVTGIVFLFVSVSQLTIYSIEVFSW